MYTGISSNCQKLAVLGITVINLYVKPFSFREQPCPFPIIDSLFYSILCGEQDGMLSSSRYCNMIDLQFKLHILT